MTSSPGFDHVWRNARIATLAAGHPGLGVVERGAIAVQDDRIAWIGEDADLPSSDAPVTDCQGRWITPGLIDCHTHLVYAGNRAREFEMRLEGASYEQIALAGGGIASSVRQLRTADENVLLDQTLPRLDALISEGVTTVEVKSGYGLDPDNERKSLRVARRLADERPVTVTTTFLGMHAMPPGESDRDAYIATVIDQMLPALADEGLMDAVDAFCEGVAFTPEEVARLFDAARDRNVPVKLHADQLSDLGGGALAARYNALSADHLEYASEESVRAMADAGTVAVLL
ncbi:MAG TPA: imidazolonepropionase, partial [Thermomicrobiales bacterium]|nr:imidazolonepropionase [Thermomicrobiales bacterium]